MRIVGHTCIVPHFSLATPEPCPQGRGVALFLLPLIGQQAHLLGLPIDQATQKGTFLVPLPALMLEGLAPHLSLLRKALSQQLELAALWWRDRLCIVAGCIGWVGWLGWCAQRAIDPLELGGIDQVMTLIILGR